MVKMAFRSTAKRDLGNIPRPIRQAILIACREIFDDWTIGKTLTNRLAGLRVYRVGVYRIIYKVRESSSIEITTIGHREDVYERAMKRG